MEHLEVKSSPFNVIKTGIGILNIVAAITLFAVYFKDKDVIPLITSLVIAFSGIYFITNGFGLERSWFRTGENFIIIKWMNMVRPVQIHVTRIVKICMERSRITVYQKARKPLKLKVDFLEREQKKEVYEFFIEFSKQRNIEIEKHYNP